MFLVLVCLFVMTSPYENALITRTRTKPSSIPDAYTCKYDLKMLSYCLDGRESIMFSQFNSLTKALVKVLRVHQQLPAIQKVNKNK